jgi:ABC-type transport system substrate-binding protein
LDDVRVRRAISYAINRTEVSELLRQGVAAPAYQPFLDGYLGYDQSLDADVYDPDEARRLVQEAGAEGATLQFLQSAGPPHDEHAQVVQQALGDIGLNVELTPISPGEAGSVFAEGDYHALVSVIAGQLDPSGTLAGAYLGGTNLAEPPAELALMAEQAQAMPFGSAERATAYQDISSYLVENPVHVPIVQWTPVTLYRSNVVGSVVTKFGPGEVRGVGIEDT